MTRIVVNIKDWFTANKLPLNVEQTKYSFFHKLCKKDDILLRLSKRIINNYEIQRKESIKLLGILLDLTWKEHIKLTETKNTKNIGILYKARSYLDKKILALPLLYGGIYVPNFLLLFIAHLQRRNLDYDIVNWIAMS